MLSPFLGTDIAAGAIFEVLANKKESGAPVYKESEKAWEQAIDITNHLRKALQPGIASNLERTYKALNGEITTSGKRYDPVQEAAGWVGWRVSTLDPKVALYYRTFEFKDALSEASTSFNQVVRNPNEVSTEEIVDALGKTQEMRARAFGRMRRIVSSAKSSGMSDSEIAKVLRTNQVSKKDVSALLGDQDYPWFPSPQSIQSASKKADMLYGPEMAVEFRRRYAEAIRIYRQ
jgi:hypothetical protein